MSDGPDVAGSPGSPVPGGDRAPGLDPRQELAELAASVRALLEWHAATGSTGVPFTPRDPAAGCDPAPPAPPPPRIAPSRGVFPRAAAAPAPPRAASSPEAPPRPSAAPVAAPAPGTASEAPAAKDEDRRLRLALLAEEVRSCTQCALHVHRTQTVFARGNPHAELCFVGEGPGAEEDAQGEPFVGPAGQLLDRMIVAMGYRPDDVYVCNVVKCRPPDNRKPDPAEMASCMPHLARQIAVVKPKAIVALGATALQGLTGTSEGITRLRGKWRLFKGTYPLMPTFHPAYVLRTPSAKRDVWTDLKEALRFLGRTPPKP